MLRAKSWAVRASGLTIQVSCGMTVAAAVAVSSAAPESSCSLERLLIGKTAGKCSPLVRSGLNDHTNGSQIAEVLASQEMV